MGQQLYFNHLSVNNGLSQGVNNCIYRDSKGFVWISSFDGLNRFDGVTCLNFRSSIFEKDGLKGTLFLNILEDQNSNLWIGSNAGLNFYNRRLDRFQNFRIEGRSKDKQYFSPFYIDNNNDVWLQSHHDIIYYNTKKNTFSFVKPFFEQGGLILCTYPKEPFQPLQKIYAISNNRPVLWQGLVNDDKISWTSNRLSIPAEQVNALVQTGENTFWYGTEKGLYKIKNNQLVNRINFYNSKEITNISTLQIDQKNTLWAGTLQQGLYRIDEATGIINYHYENSVYNPFALMGNEIQFINSDINGDLWISVWGKGVDYTNLNRFRFNYFVKKDEVAKLGADNFIRSIVQVNHEFWCGTRSGGILILNENKNIKQFLNQGLTSSIEHLFIDNNKQVWASTFEGLFIINPESKKITKIPTNTEGYGAESNQFNYTWCLNDGRILASTNAGIFVLEKADNIWRFKKLKGINYSKDVFLTTYTDHQNLIYISKAFKGFGIYKQAGDSLSLFKEFPMEASIKCFCELNDSSLWIGSTVGLIEFNKNESEIKKIYTTKDGLSNQYIYGIVPDGKFLWLSTNVGIDRLEISSKSIKAFTLSDGLQSNEFNTYSFCKAESGEILFGGVNGLNSFFPTYLKNNSYAPQLILTGVQINDTSFVQVINPSEIKDLHVNYKQNTLGFQFSVIHYANASANTLSYTLDGYDKKWITVGSNAIIRFENLPYGSYTLRVKAFNSDDIETINTYTLPITIYPPWWQTWWFRIFAATVFLGILHFISRSYLNNRLKKQKAELEKKQAIEKERNRIGRDMHDDLGSGLTMIAILSEVAKKQLPEPDKIKEILEKIAVSSRDLVDNLQDIIWVLNPKNDSLDSLSSYIREYGLKYFEPISIELDFDYPERFLNVHLSEEQRRNIFLTVKESFNNIVKHAECNKVTISIKETPKEICLRIIDNGKGFDLNQVRLFANGLKNMQNRIKNVGGTYSIISTPGKGTITEIKFKQ